MDELNKVIDEIWSIDESYRGCDTPCKHMVDDIFQGLLGFI